ncbi:MAG TPA: hypothetical protein GXX55_03560 [Firmicutes bacterium]|nr:hypothetical protein [Bacillota bacterium]
MTKLEATLRRWREDRMAFIGDLVLDDGRKLEKALTPWQREMLAGVHRHPYSYLELPRGSGKTTLVAAEAVAELFLGKPNARLYVAASDREQAGLLHEAAAGFIMRSPFLAASSEIERWRIKVPGTGSRLEVLSADGASALGLAPDLIMCDELAVWPDRSLWDALWTAAGKRRGCRVVILSTPGGDLSHFSKAIRDRATEGPPWFYFTRNEPPEWMSREYLEEQRRTLPPEVFARFFEARWVPGGGQVITEEDLKHFFDPELRPAPRGKGLGYVVGVDLGLMRDRTAIVVCHRERDGSVIVDLMDGYEAVEDSRVLFADVSQALLRIYRDFANPVFVVDVWQAFKLVEDLRKEGLRFEEAVFSPSYRHKIDSTLLRLLKDRQIRCYSGTREAHALRLEMLALQVEVKSGGWRMNHGYGGHDDFWTALAMAATRALETTMVQMDERAFEKLMTLNDSFWHASVAREIGAEDIWERNTYREWGD